MNKIPLLSILIAAYNVEKYISKCIDSCLNQDINKNEYEIIIVDDGSTDKTPEILHSYRQNNENIKVIISQNNSGLGYTRNIALENSNGKYIWFIDGDDYIESNILGGLIKKIETDKLDVLAFRYTIVSKDKKTYNNSMIANDLNRVMNGGEYYINNYKLSYIWFNLFRRTIFIDNNLRFLNRINMQDSEILPRILFHVEKLMKIDSIAYNYIQYEMSETNSNNTERRYRYFQSIITVKDSLLVYKSKIENINPLLASGIERKLESIQEVVYNHLLYFLYKRTDFNKIITLLKINHLFPIKYKMNDWRSCILFSLNIFPFFTYTIFTYIRKLKSWLV